MPIFEYKGYNSAGKAVKGNVDADSAKTARIKLKKQGVVVTDIAEKSDVRGAKTGTISFLNQIKSRDVTMMTRQLASLIKASVPLVKALNALVEQTDNEKLRVVLSQVRQDVNEGKSLHKALSSHPKAFDNIFINMVEAGETSGTLGPVLLRLAELKEAQLKLNQKVVSGMTYPGIMMVVGFGIIIGIFGFVVPKMVTIFDSQKKPLPAITHVLIFISKFVTNYWYLLIGGIIGSLFLFLRYIKSATGKPKWDAFILKVPVVGPLVRMVSITRFTTTMGTLLGSGVPIINCMTIARNLVQNTVIKSAIDSAKENIKEGQSIAEPLRKSGEFPPLVIQMIQIGEETGELPQMLRNISSIYEDQISTAVDAMTSLLEPVMIIVMGIVVAFVVIAIFLPLMEMSNIG